MTSQLALQITVGLSFLASVVFLVLLWVSTAARGFKVLYTILLLIPVLGPLAYLWIRFWPNPLPYGLNGVNAGLGRRYLDRELSTKGASESVASAREAFLEEEARHQARRQRAAKWKERLRRLGEDHRRS